MFVSTRFINLWAKLKICHFWILQWYGSTWFYQFSLILLKFTSILSDAGLIPVCRISWLCYTCGILFPQKCSTVLYESSGISFLPNQSLGHERKRSENTSQIKSSAPFPGRRKTDLETLAWKMGCINTYFFHKLHAAPNVDLSTFYCLKVSFRRVWSNLGRNCTRAMENSHQVFIYFLLFSSDLV